MTGIARSLAPAALAAAAILAFAGRADAETHDTETLALGWQAENADFVVIGVPQQDRRPGPSGPWELEFQVEEVLRGRPAPASTITLLVGDDGEGRPYQRGVRCLAFLRSIPRAGGEPERWGLLAGAFSIRAVPAEGPESRFPEIVRSIAATLGNGTEVKDPVGLRALLVKWIEDGDPGIALSAALDLVRHEELHPSLTAVERLRIVAAYRAQPIGKATKGALALAAAATRDPAAGPVLVDSLLEPRARLIRGDVGEALRRLADPATAPLLLKRLASADDGQRANLLQVLGTLGAPEGAEPARAGLASSSAEVRLESAHALGLIARAVRERDPAARVGGRAELATLLAAAAPGNESRAVLWALAQLDDADAFALLRKVAASDGREEVRRYAERILGRPRQSLILLER